MFSIVFHPTALLIELNIFYCENNKKLCTVVGCLTVDVVRCKLFDSNCFKFNLFSENFVFKKKELFSNQII